MILSRELTVKSGMVRSLRLSAVSVDIQPSSSVTTWVHCDVVSPSMSSSLSRSC